MLASGPASTPEANRMLDSHRKPNCSFYPQGYPELRAAT
ncbi:hypothetical protein ApDm4_0909 [Acetobacter pomorum]|nr:hypothetical protein ApDm4_0909 [Acetobacter pomorum]